MIPGGLIGPLGGLEQVWFSAKEDVSKASRFAVRRALSGASHAQVLPRALRSWSCELPHSAPQEDRLDEMEEWAARNRRPLVWYPADALGTNMLDPAASLMSLDRWTDAVPGGAHVRPSGSDVPRHRFSIGTESDGTWAHLSNIPVPDWDTARRTPVLTASIVLTPYAGQTAHWWIDELALDGRTTVVHKYAATKADTRLHATITPRGDTVALTYGVSRAAAASMPALTLTDRLMPWGVGRGCMAAVIDVTGRNPQWTATSHHIYQASDAVNFTIREL